MKSTFNIFFRSAGAIGGESAMFVFPGQRRV